METSEPPTSSNHDTPEPLSPVATPAPTPTPTVAPPEFRTQLNMKHLGASAIIHDVGSYQLSIVIGDPVILSRRESRSGRIVLLNSSEVLLQ